MTHAPAFAPATTSALDTAALQVVTIPATDQFSEATHHVITASVTAEDLTGSVAPALTREPATELPAHAPALLALVITLVTVGGALGLWTTLGESTRLVVMVALGLAVAAATLMIARRGRARIHP